MDARKIFTLSLVLASSIAGAAQAGPAVGTNKALGIYNQGGWESGGMARSRMAYSYRAPAIYNAPAVASTPAPAVAQAPTEGRRFSYEPSANTGSGWTCGSAPAAPATANANATGMADANRRFSYEPAPEATAPAAQPSATTYYSRPSYSSGSARRANVDRWALPKTDPRKYSSR